MPERVAARADSWLVDIARFHLLHPLHELKMRSGTRVQGNAKICCSGLVCFTQSGKAAHALHPDSKTALGPWITFASDATLDRALVYLGADPMRRWKITRQSMRAWGQSSTHIRLLQNRKNLLRIDYSKR